MSDTPTSDRLEGTDRDDVSAPLTSASIDAVLVDFRAWLLELASNRHAPAELSDDQPSCVPEVDFFTLIGQFTALRHEVNMQTRAARSAVEQNAEVLKQLSVQEPAEDDEKMRSVVKAVIDIADALMLSLRQMEKFRNSVEPLLTSGREEQDEPQQSPGFFARLFGAKTSLQSSADPTPGIEKLQQMAAAAADGYALSLRRVERLLPTLELEPLLCVGTTFDPERMEVVEVVGDTGEDAGTVVEDVRPGYMWHGKLLRFALVKVAR